MSRTRISVEADTPELLEIQEYMLEQARASSNFRWWDDANCLGLDTELFFPNSGEDANPAKLVCKECVVRLACLEEAVGNEDQTGIAGGTSATERRIIRRQNKIERKAS